MRLDGESRRRASREAECAQLENEQARLAGETEALHTKVANLTATIEALHASKTFKLRAALERLFRPLKR